MKAAFGEVADLLLTGQRGVPRRLLDLGFQFRFPELEGALRTSWHEAVKPGLNRVQS